MPTQLVTFEIKTSHFAAFQHEFAKLTRKASKLGVTAPTFVVTQRDKVIPAHPRMRQGEDQFGRPCMVNYLHPARVVHVVSVSGQAPRLGGWQFVAALQHETAGNLVRTVPGVEVQVKRDLRSAPPACEHCGLDRRRSDTYVVAHDDGRQMQVGRSCLRDFTGHDSPESIARWAELLSTFVAAINDSDGEGFSGGGTEQVATLDDFLLFVCAGIRTLGWLSRTAAREGMGSRATADGAWASLFPGSEQERQNAIQPTDADTARAAKCLEIARAHFDAHAVDALPDYEHNLRIVVEGLSVTARTAGIAASIVNFAERLMGHEIERRRRETQATTSVYVGTVGKREVMTLTVEKVISIEGAYGTSHLHIFSDAAGNALKWFSSAKRLDTGATYTGKCSVKAHEEYKGVKQTMLTRCALEPIAAAGPVAAAG